MQSTALLERIVEETKLSIAKTQKIAKYGDDLLKNKDGEDSWSILECLQHLNLYHQYYLPQIKGKMENSKFPFASEFKSGFLGNYFAKSMLPKEVINKMKTNKNKNPINDILDRKVIDDFITHQQNLLKWLNEAKHKDLNRIKIKTFISSFIYLNLGDTFQFLSNHSIRHFKQIENIERSAF